MKQLNRLWGVIALSLVSLPGWSFSLDFASANPDTIMNFIQGNNPLVYLSAFFAMGVLLAFTPCVLPMVPILSGIIVGQDKLSTSKAFKLSASYVLGMALTYAVAGMLAGYLGSTIQTLMQQPAVIVAFALLFVLMAASMLGIFELRLPSKISHRFNSSRQGSGKRSTLHVALMGVLSTLVVSPCVTAPLIGVLGYIAQNQKVFSGGIILFVMALGMGLPLLLVGAGYGSVLPRSGAWMIKIKQGFGLLMLAMAIWLLSRILSETTINFLWVALLLLSSYCLGLLKPALSKVDYLFKGIAIITLLTAGLLLYKTETQLNQVTPMTNSTAKAPFKALSTLQEINDRLAQAKTEHKPVFLEFSASWCSDCQDMDREVFNTTEVSQAMNGLVNLRVEISEKTSEVAAIKKAFGIYGTPTMLFFNPNGESLSSLTAVGLISKESMLSLLSQAKE